MFFKYFVSSKLKRNCRPLFDWTHFWDYRIPPKKKVFFKKWLQDRGYLNIADFKRISIPLVRKAYPNLIANKLVGVQPLLGPTGLVYYMRYRYSSCRNEVN